ncbi:MAG: hypothetical protein KGD65_07785 [Candidatus Lokiarchaeota archaeon]|nr:hypothetical protein [Candidatus Lokiarchaeota archaeon]
MGESNFEKRYKIEREKLLRYYDRLRNQFKNLGPSQIIARFLINQSIGSSYNEVYDTLLYFRDKIADGKELLDLAFEWIRAQKIRLEYKKYLIRAQYPNNNLSLAVDDCIFRFFLEYDTYIRDLLKEDIQEYNFSTLHEIFFSPYESKDLNIKDILEKHIHNVPTHFQSMEKINTNIIILRSGLSNIIVKDYEIVLFSRKEEKERKEVKLKKTCVVPSKEEEKFNGILLDRLIKTYCVRKIEISHKEIENAVSQFLSSYFKFGRIYDFDDFKELLIRNLAEDLTSALSEKYKEGQLLDNVKRALSNLMNSFHRVKKVKKLDGLAWKNDLTPILKNYMTKFISNLV